MKWKGSAVIPYIHPALFITPDLECAKGAGGQVPPKHSQRQGGAEMLLLSPQPEDHCSFMGYVLGKGQERE